MNSILYTNTPKTGTITVTKTITDHPEDMAVFRCTITGQSAEPTIVGPFDLSQEAPAVCKDLPYDTYVLTEEVQPGHVQVSEHEPIVLTRAARKQSVTVVNEVVYPVTPIKYGALYNFPAAGKNGGIGVGSIAPSGWHVPTATEWESLASSVINNGNNLKLSNTEFWSSANGNNSSLFSAKGAGLRLNDTGAFFGIKDYTVFASSTEISGMNQSWVTFLYDALSTISIQVNDYLFGTSVRLIKNTSDWVDGETVTDIDGNIYPTIKIGDQVWITENLAVTKFNDGTEIPNIVENALWTLYSEEAYCWYDNDINNK